MGISIGCRRTPRLLLFAASLFFLAPAWPVPAQTTRYVAPGGVDATNDCSLPASPCATVQHALGSAVNDDLIRLAAGTYSEAGIVVNKDVTIEGAGAGISTIDGAGKWQTVMTIQAGSTVTIEDLSLVRGSTGGSGGGILNYGTLTLRDAALSDNSADFGAGIANFGTATLVRCRITTNIAAGVGGGVRNAGTMSISECAIEDNHAGSGAGEGQGAGIYNLGALDVTHSTIARNEHGGIFAGSAAPTRIAHSTVIGNRGHGGGAFEGGPADILFSTIVNNGGAHGAFVDGPYRIAASIVFGNSTQGQPFCNFATIVSAGFNLMQTPDPNVCSYTGDLANDLFEVDPLLGPLANNGGSTQTLLPAGGSPAVDFVPRGTLGCDVTMTDQRGMPRAQDGNLDGDLDCDAGAVELPGPSDTTPPTITLREEPIVLWPPNGKLRPFEVTDFVASVSDNVDPLTPDDVVIKSVASDEPESGKGDATKGDIAVADDCHAVGLRAERLGKGNGRVYSIELALVDAAGNEGLATLQIYVPHDASGKHPAVNDGPAYDLACDGSDAEGVALAEIGRHGGAVQSARAGSAGPQGFVLDQNYPNPFNPTTRISFEIPEAARVQVAVFNLLGQEVLRVLDAELPAGGHAVTVDGTDLPSGLYLYRVSSSGRHLTRHMLLLK